jgi:methionine-rich copper-binding protein CopC
MKKQKPPRLGPVAIILVAFVAAWAVVSNSQSEATASFAPTVTATNPANGATGVALNQKIAVTFSQHMSPASLSTSLIVLRPDGSMVNGNVNLYYRTGMFVPSLNLAPNTKYTARVRAGASDLAGVALGHAFVWSFTTGATSDTTKPTVMFTNPANSAVGVPTNQRIIALFSKEMSPGSIGTGTFIVRKPGGIAIFGTVAYASGSITFLPTYGLRNNTHYVATIIAGAKDIAGNPLANNYVWSFDTGANSDLVKPTVTSTNPDSNATLVPIDQKVNATFSKAMNYASITTGDFLLTWSGGHVVGTVTYFYDATNNVTIATLAPVANLLTNTLYTATITNEAQDLSGNALAGNEPSHDFVWQFTTGATAGQSTVALGAAANFAVLAAAGVTNTSTPTVVPEISGCGRAPQ